MNQVATCELFNYKLNDILHVDKMFKIINLKK